MILNIFFRYLHRWKKAGAMKEMTGSDLLQQKVKIHFQNFFYLDESIQFFRGGESKIGKVYGTVAPQQYSPVLLDIDMI